MRILLTNDDGIHAPGLKVLEAIARQLVRRRFHRRAGDRPVRRRPFAVAQRSACACAKIGPRHFAVQGTPTDCVIMGVRKIMADARPDLILSGVNRGQNVAEDVTYSGTIAAAMEGTLLGIPSIALSQAYDGREGRDKPNWDCAATLGPEVIKKILRDRHARRRAGQRQFPRLPGRRGRRRDGRPRKGGATPN